MVRRFHNQNYAKLKRRCISRGELFTDPEFPPTAQSLFFSGKDDHDIVWKRPKVRKRTYTACAEPARECVCMDLVLVCGVCVCVYMCVHCTCNQK